MEWEHGVLAAAAVIAAVGIIWRGLIQPLIAALDKARTLAKIAEQFSTNGGSSLADRLARIEGKVDTLTEMRGPPRPPPED